MEGGNTLPYLPHLFPSWSTLLLGNACVCSSPLSKLHNFVFRVCSCGQRACQGLVWSTHMLPLGFGLLFMRQQYSLKRKMFAAPQIQGFFLRRWLQSWVCWECGWNITEWMWVDLAFCLTLRIICVVIPTPPCTCGTLRTVLIFPNYSFLFPEDVARMALLFEDI